MRVLQGSQGRARDGGGCARRLSRWPANSQARHAHTAQTNRYKLAAEQPNRPAGDALDYLIMQALDPEGAAAAANGGSGGQAGGLLGSLGATMASMQRFMRSLSN